MPALAPHTSRLIVDGLSDRDRHNELADNFACVGQASNARRIAVRDEVIHVSDCQTLSAADPFPSGTVRLQKNSRRVRHHTHVDCAPRRKARRLYSSYNCVTARQLAAANLIFSPGEHSQAHRDICSPSQITIHHGARG